ncbi:MAG: LysR substrate-binding domain-containing protein [Vibrio toranzoniae]|jgi:DNA-binding transcriptional LysR family regulator|uniref:LysR substrate-binding domain-containing protein n=1 Tax=Vibrio TaxID=662 RepID=UPI0013769DF8|nr:MULTISPECIES: LysR substrate-binding domain-containing protein [Vibrio]MDA0142863.1 LysR substrate-binding domain-containing protein [Vibrio sp. RW]NAZ52415.1 LysR family transcriptional regulator [Vibrio toranzoniae]NAZ71139.1 LysR family transcriptional regulator [Vibrio toranzoniae]NAZ94999.1 LysR family transcriptional regulator [Vibrio toranzoniae]
MVDVKSLLKCDMNLLLCLHVLIEERSVSKTAERLFLSQSAVSKQLTKLRSLFDDPLFERESKGLFPTPKATSLAPKIHQILLQVEQLTVPDIFEPKYSERTFNIDLVETAYTAIYPKFMPNALAEAPNITVNSTTWSSETFKRLLKREVDFGIGIFEHDERASTHIQNIPFELNYVELLQDYSVCLMRNDHPVLQEEWNLQAFLKHRHIQLVTGGVGDWLLLEVLQAKQLQINKAANVSDITSAVKLCKQSDLLMCYPYNSVRDYIESGELVMKPIPIELVPGGLFLLWHRYFDSEPSHKWLRELIVDQTR